MQAPDGGQAHVPAHLLQHPYRPFAAFQRRTLPPLRLPLSPLCLFAGSTLPLPPLPTSLPPLPPLPAGLAAGLSSSESAESSSESLSSLPKKKRFRRSYLPLLLFFKVLQAVTGYRVPATCHPCAAFCVGLSTVRPLRLLERPGGPARRRWRPRIRRAVGVLAAPSLTIRSDLVRAPLSLPSAGLRNGREVEVRPATSKGRPSRAGAES